jgi:hypothetical protein
MTNKKGWIVRCSEEEREQIRQLAKEHNMSINTYLKESALADKEIVIKQEIHKDITLRIETNDIFGLINEISECREKFTAISNMILKQGKIYPREFEELEKSLSNMEDILNDKTFEILEDRKQIKKAAQELLDKEKKKSN